MTDRTHLQFAADALEAATYARTRLRLRADHATGAYQGAMFIVKKQGELNLALQRQRPQWLAMLLAPLGLTAMGTALAVVGSGVSQVFGIFSGIQGALFTHSLMNQRKSAKRDAIEARRSMEWASEEQEENHKLAEQILARPNVRHAAKEIDGRGRHRAHGPAVSKVNWLGEETQDPFAPPAYPLGAAVAEADLLIRALADVSVALERIAPKALSAEVVRTLRRAAMDPEVEVPFATLDQAFFDGERAIADALECHAEATRTQIEPVNNELTRTTLKETRTYRAAAISF